MKRLDPTTEDSSERETLDLIEEAVQLLRTRPAILLTYFIGAVPFVTGFLYFWAEMVSDSQAHHRLPGAAMTLALLFVWMKTWQSLFMRRCLVEVGGAAEEKLGIGGWLRTASLQAPVQASGLIALPFCGIIMLPFGWAYAFYQNYSLLGMDRAPNMRQAVRDSVRQTKLWPGQNHRFIGILLVLWPVLFFNMSLALAMLPQLAKILAGMDSEFTRYNYSTFNTTYFILVGGLAYLVLDPVVKSFYAIRCFHGDSRASGEDILAALRQLPPAARQLASSAMFLMVFLFAMPSAVRAQAEPPPAVSGFDAERFNQAADQVLEQREFSWRIPREEVPREQSWFEEYVAGFFKSVADVFSNGLKAVAEWLEQWLRRRSNPANAGGQASAISQAMRVLAYGFIVAVILIGLIFFVRLWRRRPIRAAAVVIPAAPVMPDLNADQVDAGQLQVSEWLEMAQNLIREGKLRLGLRAMYLATLSGLAEKEWIRTARHKSNMDYRSEVERRAHHSPELARLFAGHVLDFERVWYGNHDIAVPGIEDFRRDYERILNLAAQ